MEGLKREIGSLSDAETLRFGVIKESLLVSYKEYMEEVARNPRLAAKLEEDRRIRELAKYGRKIRS